MTILRHFRQPHFLACLGAAVLTAVLLTAGLTVVHREPTRAAVVASHIPIVVRSNGYTTTASVQTGTIAMVLSELQIDPTGSKIYPALATQVQPNLLIEITHPLSLTITADGSTKTFATFQTTVQGAIGDADVQLGNLDKVEPSLDAPLTSDLHITIRRIQQKTVTTDLDIPFAKTTQPNPTQFVGQNTITQAGVNGTKRVTSLVTLQDGKQISKQKTGEETILTPVAQITVKGTKPVPQNSWYGDATWFYAHYPMSAAMTNVAWGTRVKVTDPSSGKSLIVPVLDKLPNWGNGVVIDLSSDAFQYFAPLGHGRLVHLTVEKIQ